MPNAKLHIQVLLKKGKRLEETIPLEKAKGSYIFKIVGDDFKEQKGLLSYKVELTQNGKILAKSRHKFWVDPIKFSE